MWDGNPDGVTKFFVGLTKSTYPVLTKGGRVGSQYRLGNNHFIVIDQGGVVRWVSSGSLGSRFNENAIVSTIQSLLPPPNTPPTITSSIPDQSGSGTEPIEIDLASFVSDEEDGPQDLMWRAEGFDPELIGVTENGTEGGMLSFTPKPEVLGQDISVLLIVSDTQGGTAEQSIILRWTFLPAVLSVSMEDLNFGSVYVGSSRTLNLIVSNGAGPGGEDLEIRTPPRVRPSVSGTRPSRFRPENPGRSQSCTGRLTKVMSTHELTFLTNDPEHEVFGVSLTGSGLPPLDIQVAVSDTDFDGDGRIDFDDFFMFAAAFGGTDPVFDLNKSGRVDFDDFFIFATDFGKIAKPDDGP